MEKKSDSELENIENWDTDNIKVEYGKQPSRVVFSVAFKRDDFERVSKYARQCGKKTSEFIREAALEKVLGIGKPSLLSYYGSSYVASWILDNHLISPISAVSAYMVDDQEKMASITS